MSLSNLIKTFSILLLIASIQCFTACTPGSSKETKLSNYDNLRLFKTDKQLVIWGINKEKGTNAKVKAHIFDPTTGNVLRNFLITSGLKNWSHLIDNNVYAHNKGVLEIRNMLTGALELNHAILEKKFKPQLTKGIHKTSSPSNSRYSPHSLWVHITTKKGQQYYYNIELDTLLNHSNYFKFRDKEAMHKKQLRRAMKTVWKSRWASSTNPDNPNETRYILTQQKVHPKYFLSVTETYSYSQDGVTEGKIKLMSKLEDNKFFLKTNGIYFGKHHALFVHQTELGGQGKTRLACQNGKGKILWEKELKSTKILEKMITTHKRHLRLIPDPANENIVAIVSHRFRYMVGLNLNTGEVVWQWKYGHYKE